MRILEVEFGYIYEAGPDSTEHNVKYNNEHERRKDYLAQNKLDHSKNAINGYAKFFVNEEQFMDMLILKFEVRLVRVMYEHKILEKVKQDIPFATDDYFNTKVQVHVPGPTMLLYNRVMLAENACTDALQDRLCEGWRIIAVSVQPDQRRPDYILGRYEEAIPNYYEGAERG